MANKMLIDASHPEETRVVVVRGNRIEEFDFESQDKKQLKGNIYLARVTRVEPSLQAAFVDYGGNRHGFLAFNEIHPDYYQIPFADRQALIKADAEAEEDDAEGDEGERPSNNKRRRGVARDRKSGGRSGKPAPREAAAPANGDKDDVVTLDPLEETADAEADAPAADETEVSSPAEDDAPSDSEDPPSGTMAMIVDADVVSEPAPSGDGDEGGNGGVTEVAAAAEDQEIESVGAEDALEELPDRRRPMRRQYKIQEVIKRRQILLVQVVKEERGNKGAALTTYLSLAGRYSVLMPNTPRGGGISRKITNAQDRKRLKDVVAELDVPQGMGVILRTAGANRTKAEIKRDYEYLMRLWENVRSLTLQSTAPALVYEEGSLIKRSVRDLYNKDIDEILVAGDDGYREAKDFMRMLMPSHAKAVQPYRDNAPIFARAGIEAQLDRLLQPQVTLKSGGYIIMNQTEALVSIDVNSGRSTREHSIEDTALQTNLEAAEEIARQLRLRDLAGLIVIDFIDMEEKRNNRAVEKRLKDHLKNDRARIQVGRISHFGLLEMSRQRIRASVLESTMQTCPHCGGSGHVRSDSSIALHVLRAVEDFLLKDNRHNVIVMTTTATALYILNHKRASLVDLERRFGLTISIDADATLAGQNYTISRGTPVERPVTIEPTRPAPPPEAEEEEEDIPVEEEAETPAETQAAKSETGDDARKRRRRRRRRGGRGRDDAAGGASDASSEAAVEENGDAIAEDGDEPEAADVAAESSTETAEAGETEAQRKKRRRGKRGGRRNRRDDEAGDAAADASETDTADEVEAAEAEVTEIVAAEVVPEPIVAETAPETAEASEPSETKADDAETPRRGRRRAAVEAPAEPVVTSAQAEEGEDKPRKGGWWQRRGFF
jgi:ribonuclease E